MNMMLSFHHLLGYEFKLIPVSPSDMLMYQDSSKVSLCSWHNQTVAIGAISLCLIVEPKVQVSSHPIVLVVARENISREISVDMNKEMIFLCNCKRHIIYYSKLFVNNYEVFYIIYILFVSALTTSIKIVIEIIRFFFFFFVH